MNNLITEETGTSILFMFHGPLALLTPFSHLGLLESGNLASVFAVTGHGFSLVSSLMYIFRGLLFLSNKNLSVLPPTFNRL